MSHSTARSVRPSNMVSPDVSQATAAPPTCRPTIRAANRPQLDRSKRLAHCAGPSPGIASQSLDPRGRRGALREDESAAPRRHSYVENLG